MVRFWMEIDGRPVNVIMGNMGLQTARNAARRLVELSRSRVGMAVDHVAVESYGSETVFMVDWGEAYPGQAHWRDRRMMMQCEHLQQGVAF
jgi:hypothetical protein